MRIHRQHLSLPLVALLLTACANLLPDASLEQPRLTAPQRSAADIVRLLREHRLDPNEVARLKRVVGTQPDATLTGDALANFFVNRGLAARALGETRQERDDFRRAIAAFGPRFSRPKHLAESYLAVSLSPNERPAAVLELLDHLPNEAFSSPWVPRFRAVALASQGRFEEADRAFASVESVYLKGLERYSGPSESHQFWRALMKVHLDGTQFQLFRSQGKWSEAEKSLREARRLVQETIRLHRFVSPDELPPNLDSLYAGVAGTSLNLTRLLLDTGRLIEAEWEARQTLIAQLTDPRHTMGGRAQAISMLARVLSARGLHNEARLIAEQALSAEQVHRADGQSRALGFAGAIILESLIVERRFEEAARRASDFIRTTDDPHDTHDDVTLWRHSWITALALGGRHREAAELAERALSAMQTKGVGDPSTLNWYSAYRDAARLQIESSGDRLETLGASMTKLSQEFMREQLTDPENSPKERRFRYLAETYLNAMAHTASAGALDPVKRGAAIASGLAISEVLRTGTARLSIAANHVRQLSGNDELAAAVRKAQDLRLKAQMLGEIANTLGSELSKESRERAAAIRTSAQVVEQERQAVQELIVSRFPRYANLISNAAVSIDEVRSSLRLNEAILSTLVGERATHVWTIRRDQAPQWVQIPIGFEAMSRRVSQLRRSLDPGEWIGQRVVPFDLDEASRLHSELIGPLNDSLHAIEKLIVVADGPLARLPFSVLVRADPKSTWSGTVDYRAVHWLVRDYAISQSPSLTSFVQLRASPPRSVHERNFIGIGDPIFRPENSLALRTTPETGPPIWRRMPGLRNAVNPRLADLPSLPDTNIEVRAVARILNADADRDVLLRERASEANVRSEAVESARVLLFATHGLAAGDLTDLHEPALALSSPSVVGGTGDGLLTASEIVSLRLSADWVVLSACSTADYDGLGVKSLFGLSSAFFYAGARALLVTHWPVETRAASAIVVKTFEHYQQDPKSDKARSLQSAMLWFIDQANAPEDPVDPSTRHPAFWAPFSLVGD